MQFLIFFGVALTIFGLVNWYLGWRGWQALAAWFPAADHRVYAALFCLLAFSYVLGRAGSRFLPAFVADSLTIFGSYWMAVMFYGLLLLLCVDLIRLADHFTGFLPAALPWARIAGPAVLLALTGIIGFGIWNARHPVVTHYEIQVDKPAPEGMESLRLVMVSDIHSGLILNNGRLAGLVELINAQEPDLVVFAGDMIDEDVTVFAEEKMAANFCHINAPYGVYACLGNHEYFAGPVEDVEHYLQQGGVVLLRDQSQRLAPALLLAGRDEAGAGGSGYVSEHQAVALAQVLEGSEPDDTVIVLDHVPSRLDEAQAAGVDLLLCGHTHHGQLWPNNYLTERIYPLDYGLYKEGPFHAIVSSGYGTWGPPLRLGSHAEIVDITIRFQD